MRPEKCAALYPHTPSAHWRTVAVLRQYRFRALAQNRRTLAHWRGVTA